MSPLPALADCASPVGVEADMYYNTTYKRVQYCDGTNWVNMGVSSLGSSDNLGNHTATGTLYMAGHPLWDASSLYLRDTNGNDGKWGGINTADNVMNFQRRTLSTGALEATVANLNLTTGTFTATAFVGDGSGLTGITGSADNLGNHIATSVLRSDTNNTDDLGTTAIRWKDGWFAGAVTAGSFSGVGTNLTALNATNLGSGTVPTARLGSGTADATTYLRGDGSWQAVPAGADDLGAGGTTQGTLYSKNTTTGFGYIGGESGATGAYLRFDNSPAASAGRVYTNLLGNWEYVTHPDYFGPYVTNANDLGSTGVRWADGWFAGTVTAATFAGSGASLTGIVSAGITDNTIVALDIAADAVGASELAANAVASANIIDGTIVAADLATGLTLVPGSLCGLAQGSGGCGGSCGTFANIVNCNGSNTASACPTGFTSRTVVLRDGGPTCNFGQAATTCFKTCTKN